VSMPGKGACSEVISLRIPVSVLSSSAHRLINGLHDDLFAFTAVSVTADRSRAPSPLSHALSLYGR